VNERIPNPKRNFLVENSIFDDVRLKGETIEQGRSGYLSRYSGSGGRRVVYAGTLETYQGIDMLIQGFATVAQCLDDVELIIVGGRTEQVASYRNYAERYGLTRKVWFTGAVSKQEASRWIQRADILVSPRCLGTNTPLKIYELMASGRPLVATRIHSHTQVLDEEAAFLVEPNSDDLAEGIVVALTNPELAKAKASHAQEIYMRSYSKETYIQKMASIFNQLKSCAE
jgi:glycosyltransferase involved in cell wall biosynthesis